MSEPIRPGSDGPGDDASAPSPFDRPSLEPERKSGPGVGKPLLIGCGVLLLLVLAAGVLFVTYQDEIAAWLFEAMEGQLRPLLPEDLPPEVRQRYEAAFDDAVAALRAGDYDPFAMQDAQREFTQVARGISGEGDAARMSREDVERLIAALEKIPSGSGDGEGGGETGAVDEGLSAAEPVRAPAAPPAA